MLIWLTVYINTQIYCAIHGKAEDINWETYFENADHQYINLRFLGDGRNLAWILVFWWVCKIIYWIGKNLFF